METKNSKAGHNLRLLQVTVESASQPIARDATLRLRTQSAPASSHFMEIHIDGRIMAQWNLSLLANQLSNAARELSCKFRSSAKEKVLQLMLPMPVPSEAEDTQSSSFPSVQTYPSNCLKIIRLHLHTHQDFHTAVAYLSKEAGLTHKTMPDSSSRGSPFPRALSAMSVFRGTADVVTSTLSSSQEKPPHFVPATSQKTHSGKVHEARMLALNGAASRSSSVVQNRATFNPTPRLISRRLSTYVPYASSYDTQSSPITTKRSGSLRKYSVFENQITRPSTAVQYPDVREDPNHNPAQMRSQAPGHQFFQTNARVSPVSHGNISMPQSSQERPLLGTLEAYQSHRISYNPSQETSASTQVVDEGFHDSAISGTASNKVDQMQLKSQFRTTLGEASQDQEALGWSAASSASVALDHELPATAHSMWAGIQSCQLNDPEPSLYRGQHPESSSRNLNMRSEDYTLPRTSFGHSAPPTAPSHPPTGSFASSSATTDSLTRLSPQKHSSPGENSTKITNLNGRGNSNGTVKVKEGDTSRLSTNEVADVRATNTTNKRPASRQARPQPKAKRPRKANQSAQVYQTKPSRPLTRASKRSEGVLTTNVQEERGSRTLNGAQPPSTDVVLAQVIQSPAQVDENDGRRAPPAPQSDIVAATPLDIQRAAQDRLETEAEPGHAGQGGHLVASSACMRCRRKHQRCNGFRPTCESCTKSGVSVCVYPDEVSKINHRQYLRPSHPEFVAPDETAGMPAEDAVNSQSHLQHARHNEGIRKDGSPAVATVDCGTSTDSRMTDTCVQTDAPKRLQMDLLEWRRLVERGMALEAAHLSKAIDNLKDISDSSVDEQVKLLRAAQHGGQFVRDLLNLFRRQVTIS